MEIIWVHSIILNSNYQYKFVHSWENSQSCKNNDKVLLLTIIKLFSEQWLDYCYRFIDVFSLGPEIICKLYWNMITIYEDPQKINALVY